jgi:DNA-binding NarL/FixJ family response regulator
MGGFTPYPLRADREVDQEAGDDADQVGDEVEQAQPNQHLHDADVDRQRGEGGEAEVREPLCGQLHPLERPDLVQQVVVQNRDLDGGDSGRQQRHAFDAVQHDERGVVDDDATGADHGEPAQPGQVAVWHRRPLRGRSLRPCSTVTDRSGRCLPPGMRSRTLLRPPPSGLARLEPRCGFVAYQGVEPWVMNIRILLADDHAMVRQGLRGFLSLSDDLETVGEATDGTEAVDLAHRLRPDLVLMDLLMPGLDGISATAAIRRDLPAVEVMALSGYLEPRMIADALHAGAVGYLLKDTDADELQRAVRAAAAGQVQLSPAVAARLVRDVHVPANPPQFTRREEQVLVLLARGRANGQIARELHIAPQTVKTHVSSILGKLGAQSRTQAALYAMRTGLVPTHAAGST